MQEFRKKGLNMLVCMEGGREETGDRQGNKRDTAREGGERRYSWYITPPLDCMCLASCVIRS